MDCFLTLSKFRIIYLFWLKLSIFQNLVELKNMTDKMNRNL